MRVYISGRITGLNDKLVERKFRAAETLLKDLGFEPVNPLKNGLDSSHTWEEHMTKDIEMLMPCDAIFMLDNWKLSRGARIEYNIARETGKKLLFETLFMGDHKVGVSDIQSAILEVTGLTLKEYSSKRRHRDAFYARMIFIYHAEKAGINMKVISQLTSRDRATVMYHLKKYHMDYRYDRTFRALAKRVSEIINNQK